MTTDFFQLDGFFTISDGTFHSSLWASLLMDYEVFDQHLDFTSFVTELAFVFHLLDEGSNHTIGHVATCWLASSDDTQDTS